MRKKMWQVTACTFMVAALGACGGGGKSTMSTSGGGTAAPDADQGRTQRIPVTRTSGRINFESIPLRAAGGLDYGAIVAKPARGVLVDLLSPDGTVLASARTDAQGRYATDLPPGSVVKVKIHASMLRPDATAGQTPLEVLDNTRQAALWTAITDVPDVLIGNAELITLIPAGGPAAGGGDRAAAPFAILDAIYDAQSKVLEAAPATVFPPTAVLWSPENRVSEQTDILKGQFPGWITFTADNTAYIPLMGKLDVDTDEYDSAIVTAQWMHSYHRALGRDDSLLGRSSWGTQVDRTRAFSDGLALAFAGIAQGSPTILESYGQHQGFTAGLLDVSASPTSTRGWFNSLSIAYLLWHLHQRVGLAPVLQTVTGPMRTAVAASGIHSFAAGLAQISPAAMAVFTPLLASQGVSPTADAWGVGETNTGGSPVAFPLVRTLAVGSAPTQACVSNLHDLGEQNNGLGSVAYLRFHLPARSAWRIKADGPAGSSPGVRVISASGQVASVHPASGSNLSMLTTQDAGDYFVAVVDRAATSSRTCFDVTIQAEATTP